jgi:predicted regulator of Ras-like GTPase activity (Roadblock/LC7/MglB family)
MGVNQQNNPSGNFAALGYGAESMPNNSPSRGVGSPAQASSDRGFQSDLSLPGGINKEEQTVSGSAVNTYGQAIAPPGFSAEASAMPSYPKQPLEGSTPFSASTSRPPDSVPAADAQGQPLPMSGAPPILAGTANNFSPQPGAPVPLPPKIQGVGRLDSRPDTSVDQGSGRIASIGKFLLDNKDLEKLGRLSESDLTGTSMRILTKDAAQELQQLLFHVGEQEGVIGSVIVGHDGLLIANTMPQDIDAESTGQWALGIYMNTTTSVKKIGQDRVHQIVGKTPRGYIVIADFGGGLLVTISQGKDTDALIPLMRSITQLVAQ